MTGRHSPLTTRVTVLTIATFVGSPFAQMVTQGQAATPTATTPKPATAAQTPATAAPKPSGPVTTPATTASKPATVAAKPAPAPDGDWPRAFTPASGSTFAVYQPQVSSWLDQKEIVLYAAVAYTSKGAREPAMGTLRIESKTSVALDERLVSFSELKITQSNFPTLQRDQAQAVIKDITDSVTLQDRVIGLDRVLANVDTSQILPKNVEGVKADPPPIFFSKTPAVLVNIDGQPIWSPIANNDLQTAVNTNWDLFQHVPTKTLFLRNEKIWLKATAVQGPWTPAGTLPDSFKKLPSDANWKDVKDSLPGKKVSANQVPKVFVSLQPSEMILLKGEPEYEAVPGAPQLLWVRNTESDVFRVGPTGPVYFLVSGRWFSAADFAGPWTFATTTLPEDFKKIPLEHDRSRVLASIPGTTQAAEAILLAQIPQTASVSRILGAPEVVYQGGAPEFEPIEKTTVQRAVNTDKDILKVGDLYYMCFQGVWFLSQAATGPWTVTSDVPAAIYEIPVSSPSYAVTYVTVEESNDDAVVFATAMAYTGAMVAFGCVMWGTGYYYPPYVWYGGMYPAYYGRYPSYGYGASYNPWTGAYSRGAVAYGPYGGAGVGARYNPRTGTYSRGAAAYGPYGSRGAASAYNPRTGTAGTTRQGSNVYGSWGSTAVARGDQWATTSRVTNDRTGTTTRTGQTSNGGEVVTRNGPGGSSAIGRTGSGDVYAGKDGNVYRKQGEGWQQYGDGGWSSVDKPTPSSTARNSWDPGTSSQVTRDSAARSDGAARTSDLGSVRSGSSSSRAGSYRPTAPRGGGGGGGRRR